MASLFTTKTRVAGPELIQSNVLPRAVANALPVNGHMSLTTTLQGLAALETQWKSLEQESLNTLSVFQSYAWVLNWAKIYMTGTSKSELCIITGYVHARLVFVLPLMKERRGPITVLRWLSEPFAQYGDILISPGENSKTWLRNATDFIGHLRDIDIVRLRHVREDAGIADFCRTDLVDARHDAQAPFLDLTAFTSDESYDARYTSTQRKRRKKIRKELETLGPIEFRILPSGSLNDTAIQEAILEKNKWLKERGRYNRILSCPSHMRFLKNLSRSKVEGAEMVTSELRAGDKPISWEIGFNFRGTHFAYITSHVNALTDLSPGRLHMDLSQRHCIRQGLQRFDLMVPNDPHKESWSSGHVATSDYYLPLTLAGHVFGQGYLRTLRPIIREVYYKTPAWLLKIIKPIFGI